MRQTTLIAALLVLVGCQAATVDGYEAAYCATGAGLLPEGVPTCEGWDRVWTSPVATPDEVNGYCGNIRMACATPRLCDAEGNPEWRTQQGTYLGVRPRWGAHQAASPDIACVDGIPLCPDGSTPLCFWEGYARAVEEAPRPNAPDCSGLLTEPCE